MLSKTIMILLVSLLSLVACAPKPTPARLPATTPVPAIPTTPAMAIPSPEEVGWAKVVAAAKQEGKVTAYSFFLIGDLAKAVSMAFEDKYGIKVEIVSGFGAVLMERLKSEKAARRNIGDVFDSGTTLLIMAKDAGLTASVGSLPALAEKDVWNLPPSLDPEGYILSTSSVVVSIYVNTNLVKAGQEPKSYRELLESKWKGKIGMVSPLIAPSSIYSYVARRQLGLDEDYWRQIGKQDLRVAPSVREGDNLLVRGEVSVLHGGTSISVGPLLKEGAPIKPVEPEEGVITTPGGVISLLKDAPHPNAARLFLNWLFTAEGQRLWAEQLSALSVRKDVPNFQPSTLIMPMKKVIYFSLDDVLENAKVQREGTLTKLLGLEMK